MNKRIISLVLALVMVLSTFSSVFAAEANKDAKEPKKDEKVEKVEKVLGKDQKIQYVIDHKFVEGYEDGTYGYDKTIKRSEITKLLVYANGHEDLAKRLQGSMKIYTDVDTKHWANGVISVGSTVPSEANGLPMLIGYPDNSFKPEKDVTYAELAKMLVVLVKKDLTKEMHDNAIWASSWMTWAAQLGILDDVNVANSNDPATRADAFVMLYNALYSMKYIKKFAATDELGILSQLKNNKITLNQGKKMKEYTITNDTTFILYNQWNQLDVQANDKAKHSGKFSRVVKVRAIDNPKYYYGSLMRVITDTKGNVTHVLELGNPRYLALGDYKNEDDAATIRNWNIDPNNRWADIADATAETRVIEESTDRDYINLKGIAAKIHYSDGKAKEIAFYDGTFTNNPTSRPENTANQDNDNNNYAPNWYTNENTTNLKLAAKLNSDTRYFVADVEANQLTEVDSVDEAITILGLTRASNWFFDVYVGYDNIGGTKKHETSQPTRIHDYNVAKVVVFNSVQKDNNNSQLLRVKNEATRLYDATLERTNGEVVVFNVEKYRGGFPFNYTDVKYNVIEITENAANGIGIELKIDHEATDKYPIVEVIDKDGSQLVLRDVKGNTARVTLGSGYDQFLEKQDLVGKHIQFRTAAGNELNGIVNETNVLEIVSIVPHALKGVLQGVVYDNQDNQKYGWIELKDIDVSTGNIHSQFVQIKEYYDFYNDKNGTFKHDYWVDKTEAKLLMIYLRAQTNNIADFRYKVQKDTNDRLKAYDFEVLVDNETKWIPLKDWTVADKVAQIKDLIQKLSNDYNKGLDVNATNYKDADKAIKNIDDLIIKLDINDAAEWSNAVNDNYRDALKDVRDAVDAFKNAQAETDAEMIKVSGSSIGMIAKDKIKPADTIAALESKVESIVDTNKVEVMVELLNAPADNANYAQGAEVKAKVKLSYKTKAGIEAEKSITTTIEKL